MNKNTLYKKYLIYDVLAALIVWFGFVVFRKYINDIEIFDSIRILIPRFNYIGSLILFPFYCVFIFSLSGFYINPLNKSRVELVFNTLFSSIIIAVSVFFVFKLGDVAVSYGYFYFSLLFLIFLLFTITLVFRSLIFSSIEKKYISKKWTINTIVIGTGKTALKIANDIKKYSPKNNFIGFVSVDSKYSVPKDEILGSMKQIASVVESHNIQETIVVLDNTDEHQLFSIINTLYRFNVGIQFTPRLYEILTGSAKINKLGINPLVSITDSTLPDWQASMKRFADIIVSFISLLVLSPFLLYCMLRIKLDSKGSVFFTQERIGLNGQPFNILKFRTMFVGAESGVPQLSSADDGRITTVGRVLRKYRIDEIPQFWNILKGEMSLVGPRPERRYYIKEIIDQAPYYCLIYKIRPGLTSWGPVRIGYADTIEKMIERLNYDVIYIENMSLLVDLKILVYTIEIIFKGKGV